MSKSRSSTICVVFERSDHHCCDYLVLILPSSSAACSIERMAKFLEILRRRFPSTPIYGRAESAHVRAISMLMYISMINGALERSEAQLKVVVKDGEEIGPTILYSRRTPTKIRRQTENGPFQGHQKHQHCQLCERRN